MGITFNLRNSLSGLISTGIPFIFKGMINEFLEDNKIDVPTTVTWVTEKKDLLELFKEYSNDNFETMVQRAAHFVKDTSWITSEWLIDACREEHPELSSLFKGWDEARAWLDIQTENFRKEFNKVVAEDTKVYKNGDLETEEPTKTIGQEKAPLDPAAPATIPETIMEENKKTEKSKSFPSLV